MADNIFGERFYGHRNKAWHNLGVVTQEGVGAVEALSILGGGYSFEKRPVTVFLNGKETVVNDSYAIVRSATPDDNQERIFNYVTGRYNIIQPLTVCEMFDDFVEEDVETLGMLGIGEKLFLTWQLPEISVNGNDKIQPYGFIAVGYDGKYGITLNVVQTRVVCQNTWNVAVREAENSKFENFGKIWQGKHHSPNIERDLGLWMGHVQQSALNQVAKSEKDYAIMADTKMSKDDAIKILFGIYPDPKQIGNMPEIIKREKSEVHAKKLEYAQNDRELVMNLFEGAGTGIDATAWGLFNAVTEYENWGRMTKKPADQSIVMGNRANTMNKAMSNIMEYALLQK